MNELSLFTLIAMNYLVAGCFYSLPAHKLMLEKLSILGLSFSWFFFAAIVWTISHTEGFFIESDTFFFPWMQTGFYRIDGLSLPLIFLTLCSGSLVVFYTLVTEKNNPNIFIGHIFLLIGSLIGFFTTFNLVLFYIFFEVMLIPMFLIILGWGGTERFYAARKFFIYTFSGSIFLLLGLIFLIQQSKAQGIIDYFSFVSLAQLQLSSQDQLILAILLSLGFLIKMPIWPLHTWLPHAHTQAPTGGSVMLAAIMLKVGGYGMLRLVLPLAAQGLFLIAPYLQITSVMAIVYIGLVTLVQTDMKKMIAYSSVAHMGFVSLGLCMLLQAKHQQDDLTFKLIFDGLYIQMISHGFISSGLFFCVGMIYKRTHSRALFSYGGLSQFMPYMTASFIFFSLANSALPGTSGFVGEFLIILGTYTLRPELAMMAACSLVTNASYNLWLVKQLFYGPVRNEQGLIFDDCTFEEKIILGTIIVLIMFLGIYPSLLSKTLDLFSTKMFAELKLS